MSRSAHKETSESKARDCARRQADARGVPAEIMLPRVILVVATVLLSLLGLVMGFSASSIEAISLDENVYSFVGKQAAIMALGALLAYGIGKHVRYHIWRDTKIFWAVWAVIAGLLIAVLFFGTNILGATRWIYVFGFSLQPSEFAKIIFVIAAARFLAEYTAGERTLRQLVVALIVAVVLPLAFLYKTQSDMGTAIIVVMGLLAVLWVGEVPTPIIVGVTIALVVAGAVGMVGYRADRLQVWLDPWSDMYGTGYQVIRSFYAFAEGGIFGVGLGNSREKFQYLSEAETDFIYAIIGEELGLIGAVAVIALFLAVLFAGLRIARFAPDDFGRMMAGGLTVMLVGQAFLNMACVTGIFPVTGKPLPFISSGGSSVLSSLLIVGLIMSVSVGSNTLTPYEQRRNNLNVIRVEHDRPERTARPERTGRGARPAADPLGTVQAPRAFDVGPRAGRARSVQQHEPASERAESKREKADRTERKRGFGSMLKLPSASGDAKKGAREQRPASSDRDARRERAAQRMRDSERNNR